MMQHSHLIGDHMSCFHDHAVLSKTYICQSSGAFPDAYDRVSDVLASCQLASFLEVIHPVVGIVRTGVLAPFMQVCLVFCFSLHG